MNSVFNTVSEWFMVNSLSLNLNKTYHGIQVFRMHKYIINIMFSCKDNHVDTYSENEKYCPYHLNIYIYIYIYSVLLFVINNRNQFIINSEIHRIYSRQFNNFHQLRSNSSKSQKELQHWHSQNCGNLLYVCVCMCVYTHTHTYTHIHTRIPDLSEFWNRIWYEFTIVQYLCT